MAALARAAAPASASPKLNARVKRVIDKLNADTRRLKQHPPARQKAGEPAKAAKAPPNEKAAGASAKQVDKLDAAETPKPETADFLSTLQGEIAKAMPKTLGDTEKFMKGGSSSEMKGSLKGNVEQQKAEATGDMKAASGQAPSEAGVPAKPVVPIPPEPGVPAPQVNAAEAMPEPKPDAEISLQASKADVADEMKRNKIDDAQMQKDPGFAPFTSFTKARGEVAKQADSGPVKYRASEGATLARTAGAAIGAARKGVGLLLGVKSGSKAKVLSRQEKQKQDEETQLTKFTQFVVDTFKNTKTAVDDRLAKLEAKVNETFDAGVDAAIASMKSLVEDQLFDYKLKRYLLMPGGSLLWIKDQILELPEEVNRFYEQGRALFLKQMFALSARVVGLMDSELAAAKADVKRAQAVISTAQAALSPAVQARAAQTTSEYAGRFSELESGIEDKAQQMRDGLLEKGREAVNKMLEAENEIRNANKGLVAQAKEKIGEVVKALSEFKDRLMGILRKGGDTIDLIVKDPMQFLSNLLAAIKGGFQQFVGNIWDHLKRGFVKWLFGALAGAGITIPSDLSVPSILKLVLDVLGITYERMRAKAVKLLGPTAVTVIEKLVGYVKTLIGGGPAALWAQIKADLSNLKEMVIDAIQNWIVTTIVKKAVAKIVSMFNPAGAIIQAIMTIYNVVSFIVERAAQIADFVESVIDSVHAIATGAIGGAVSAIEKALGNLVPILIGFLASFVGLGGLGDKIKEFIKKVQAKVDGAIDKVLKKAVGYIKGLFGKLGGKGKEDKRTDAQKLADLDKAVNEATALARDKTVPAKKLDKKLGGIKKKYQLTMLSATVDASTGKTELVHILAEINPKKRADVSKPKVEMDHVDVDFKCKSSLDETEFTNQIKAQLAELKNIDVKTFLQRRTDFKNRLAEQKKAKRANPQGRDPAGDKLANEHRERKIRDKATEIKNANPKLSLAQAMARARKWAEDKAVIHTLDQVAGGSGKKLEENLGGAREDFSIGAQWRAKKRIGRIEESAEKVPDESRSDVTLNVSMTVNSKPVL
jgi:hypothetical protein